MKLLVDTHIWLWSLLEPARLSAKVAAALLAASGVNVLPNRRVQRPGNPANP